MEKFIEKYKSYSSKVLQKLAKVKTGDELDAIQSILASRGASQEHPAEEGAVYNATEPEEYKAENGIKENDEVAEEKPKKARKAKTPKEPKEPRPLKKEVSSEEAKANLENAKTNIGRFCKFICTKTKEQTDGIIIGNDVEIGAETTILPGTILRGKTKIGAKCTIGPNCLIEDCRIGDHVTLNYVQAFESEIEDAVKAGPFVHIRPNSHLKNGVKIGDFVEVKNSTVGEQTAIAHLTYVGDSDVGKKVNFGCGTVTVNYDGLKKQRCVIGDNCFIGCNTNLIAPVELGKGAYTAAGSTVTKDVPDYALAVERADLKVKEGYSLKKLKSKLFPEDGAKK